MVYGHVAHEQITESDLLTMELYYRREGNVSPDQAQRLLRHVAKQLGKPTINLEPAATRQKETA